MKKLICSALAAMTLATFAEMKIGTVDMYTLVRNHPSYDTNKKLLQDTEKDYKRHFDTLKEELDQMQEEGKKKADEYRNPMLAAAAKSKLETELMALQQKAVAHQQKMRSEAARSQQELSDLEGRLLKAQTEDLKARVRNFATKNGYDLILDGASALYQGPDFDVTDAVLVEMGVDPKAAKEKMKDESK